MLCCSDLPPEKTDKAIADIIAEVGLTEKVDSAAGSLSGGQKRKYAQQSFQLVSQFSAYAG